MTDQVEINDKAEPALQQPGGKRNLSKSATRALDVLEYFAVVGRPLRAVEIAQALDFHTSSTDQLLKTMVDSAYLMFDAGDKLYYPSPRLVNFGTWLAGNYFGEDRICRLLRAVHQESGEIVTLSTRHGNSMQIVDFVEPVVRAGTVVKGTRIAISGSVIGTAFLSLHSDKEVIRITDQISRDSGNKMSVPELRELLARVQEARDNGYVTGAAIAVAEPWALAVPLPRPTSGMKMVLGMAGEKESVQQREQELVTLIKRSIDFWLVDHG